MRPTAKAQVAELKQQVQQKQKEIERLKKALGQSGNPQQSTMKATTAAPAHLSLTPTDFTDLLLPQLRAYTFVFYMHLKNLHEQQLVCLSIEQLLTAIRDGVREGKYKRPLLHAELFTDDQLEPLATLKERIAADHEAMRELQRRSRGRDDVLKKVQEGLESLLHEVKKGKGHEDDKNDDSLGPGSSNTSARNPPALMRGLEEEEMEVVKSGPNYDDDDDSDDDTDSSDTDME